MNQELRKIGGHKRGKISVVSLVIYTTHRNPQINLAPSIFFNSNFQRDDYNHEANWDIIWNQNVLLSISNLRTTMWWKIYYQASEITRYKRRYIHICLQFYSSIACFVWKPEHFEVQSYGGAWHKAAIPFVEKYLPISWFVAFSEVRALGKVLM